MMKGSVEGGAAYYSNPNVEACKQFLTEAGLSLNAEATRWECPCGKMWGGLDWNKQTGWYAFYANK